MSVEKSAGAVIFTQHHFSRKPSGRENHIKSGAGFRREKGKIYYLILNYSAIGKIEKTYWGLPKGRIEKGEKTEETAKREIEEETGIKDIKFIEGFKETERYFFKFKEENIIKFVTFYLVETKTKNVKLSEEHVGYQWLPYQEAFKRITFKNAKEILKKANQFLLKPR